MCPDCKANSASSRYPFPFRYLGCVSLALNLEQSLLTVREEGLLAQRRGISGINSSMTTPVAQSHVSNDDHHDRHSGCQPPTSWTARRSPFSIGQDYTIYI